MINTLLAIVISFGKIGFSALGGGNAMLKLLEYESVVLRHWLTKEEYLNILGSSFLFPGLTAVKISALIGYKAGGFAGLILAVISLNLPGILLTYIGYQWLLAHDNYYTRKLMIAVQYGALVLLAAVSFSLAQDVLKIHYSLLMVMFSVLFFISLAFWQLSPFWGFITFIGIGFFLVS